MKTQTRASLVKIMFLLTGSVLPSHASSFSTASTNTARSLHIRDNTSCKAVDSALPDTFICKSGTNCISLDNSSSAVCCPDDGNCNNIEPVSCDISKQNVATNPGSSIFTTKTQSNLPTCGNQCCPFGYTCNQSNDGNNAICQLNVQTSSLNSNKPSSSSASSTSTATSSSPSSTKTSIASGIDSNIPQSRPQCNKFPAGVFLAGFFPGIVIGILCMLAWVICSGRNRKSDYRQSQSSSLYNHKPVISDPIPLGMSGSRTDFLRRTTTRAKSIFSNKSSPRADSNPWKMPTPPAVSNIPPQPLGIPVTPERRLAHEPSTESIKVYTPPGVVQYQRPAQVMTADRKLAPLRGMATQRPRQASPTANRDGESTIGSPFKTPPNVTGNTYYGTSEMTPASTGTQNNSETLSPARYDEGNRPYETTTGPYRGDGTGETGRRTTTFTEMLHGIGFPDPMSRKNVPAVPKVPKGYMRGDRI